MMSDFGIVISLFVTATMASFLGLLALTALTGKRQIARDTVFAGDNAPVMYLFDGDTLLDATPAARALLSQSPIIGAPWTRFLARFGPRFGDLEQKVLSLPKDGQVTLHDTATGDDAMVMRADNIGGVTRIILGNEDGTGIPKGQGTLLQRAQVDELAKLRHVVGQAPCLIWRVRADGEVTWGNAAYLALVTERLPAGQELSWPLPCLFDRGIGVGAKGQRQRLDLPDGTVAWYDMQTCEDRDTTLHFAVAADNAVQAETALRDFMQTLTRTFAHLPIGLAIFDKTRKLHLFNPALPDLTALSPEFLTARPTLVSFLDAMREKAMMPEPKDYRSWRKQMVDLEAAASTGVHEEVWSLPGGQTYRVVGRPHPNGAMALMFEDISTEILRTRRYRAELELSQSVIDMLDEGIAVFSQNGSLVMNNAAYSALWDHNLGPDLADISAASVIHHWRQASSPTPLWTAAEEFVATIGEREAWDGETRLSDGRLVNCRFVPLTGGATLVSFRTLSPADFARTSVQAPGLLTA